MLRAFRRFVVLRRVIVNLTDGTSIAGILYRQSGPLLFLRDAVYFEPGRDGLALDGEAIVERDRVQFIQAAALPAAMGGAAHGSGNQ